MLQAITRSLGILSLLAFAQVLPAQNLDQIKKDVSYLASDALEGRSTGQRGEHLAAGYIAARFQQIGLQPKGGSGGYFQDFYFKPGSDPHGSETSSSANPTGADQIRGSNVVAYLDRGAPRTIIVGAHYDHLGYGEVGSLHPATEKAIHNGADDNASGVAILLQLAERMKSNRVKSNYLFIAFSGEERGLLGSNFFAKHPTIDLKQVSCMINLDMVGRLKDGNKLAVNGTGTSPEWPSLLQHVKPRNLEYVLSESGIGPSDHTSFYLQDLPVLHFFTGQHEDYHKPGDDTEKVNFEGMLIISKLLESLLFELDGKPKLAFTKTKEPEKSDAPRFTVTLGVIPDYLYSEGGMRLDGVREGKPGSKAGLQKGDIITSMAGTPIKDVQSYMETLAKFKKGDSAKIQYLRDGKPQEVEVHFE